MAETFSLQLARFAEKAKGNAEQVFRKASIEIAKSVILKSPVDTGRFRANWVFGQDAIGDTTATTDKSGNQTINRVSGQIMQVQIGESVYLSNSLPYARRLEYGYSQQAPAGMVRVTVAEWESFIKKAVESLE